MYRLIYVYTCIFMHHGLLCVNPYFCAYSVGFIRGTMRFWPYFVKMRKNKIFGIFAQFA